MSKKLLLLIPFFFSFILGYGQVANYSFSQASGTYAALTGVPNDSWNDFVTGNTIPIGFSFNFNGINYTTCSANSNGYITFGTTLSSATSYTPISSNTGFEGAISALGMDLVDNNSAIVYGLIGSAPNRVFVMQWTNARRFDNGTRNGNFDFQIRLNESSNVIQVIYGGCATNYNTDLTAQVGLRGLNNTDFNNRLVTNNWPTSTAGINNTASCRTGNGSGELPLNGLTYTWTPKPVITSFTPNNACAAPGISVVITGRNFTGTTAVNFNGVPASFTVNSNTQITAQLPATATTGFITVTTSGGTGTSLSSFVVNTPVGDQISYGNNSWLGYVYASTNGGNPPSNAFTTNYSGYVSQAEIFDLNLVNGSLSGPNLCNTYADNFAIRFKMNKNLVAGYYTFNVGGDDGYRLSLDGGATYVIDNWGAHSYQSTTFTAFLNGNTNFILEYFENSGESRVQFSYTSCTTISTAPTAIAGPTAICNGDTTTLTATGGTTATNSVYQWGTGSTIGNNIIAGQTGVSLIVNPVATTVYWVRRLDCNTYPTGGVTKTITVNPPVTISLAKTDETCSVNNDGKINATLSGGLTNIRYVKLTQKYASWQQVQEIQAFEIFTGVNVALASNGALGISTSNYLNDAVNYGPQKAIDGISTGNNFWHSNSTNINESINIDLQSGKNIDYLRIYNRSDCCQDRGQNMLLELFDGSNKLLYSKTVNLWENINGPHYVDINVLDVNWSDGGSGLNRVGLDTGNYIFNYADATSCSNNTSINIGSINTSPSAPVASALIHPNCAIASGSVTLSGLPATGTWTLYQNGVSIGMGTGDIKIISGLAPGNYNFTVSNGTCMSPLSSNVLINPLPLVATYNGSWTNGIPTIDQSIVFASSYSSIGNLEGCNCTVNAGVKVVIKNSHTLKIANEVTVNTAAGTSLTFENNASLIQNNDAAINFGNIIYERETAPIKKFDYTYWSSPVLSQKLIDVSPNTNNDKFYSYNASINDWKKENPQDLMQIGKGYIIRAPENIAVPPAPMGLYKASFVGVPFNGALSIPGIIADRPYLLGNPYPSGLDADKFLIANSSVSDGTLYFWTHNTAIGIGVSNPGTGDYAYSSDDYATYNLTGGVGTGNYIGGVEQTGNKPTGKIASGQAFFSSTKSAPTGSTIIFNNSMRVDVDGKIIGNSEFFKIKNLEKKTNTVEKHRIWLNITNVRGAFKQMLVGYVTGATNGIDTSFDGKSFNGNEFLDFYSVIENEILTIQGRALPFNENDTVLLGYSSTMGGDFSIRIDQVDGQLISQNVYIEDKTDNSLHDLKKAAYNFKTEKGVFNDRFVLRYTNKTLGLGDFDKIEQAVSVSVKNKQIKINSALGIIDKVLIYDLLGKQIYKKTNVENNEFMVRDLGSSEQALIVKTILQNGQTVTNKIIL